MVNKEAMKQWADDLSKAYDILAFGHTERALEILAKTRNAMREALAEQPAQQEPVAWAVYESDGTHHNKPCQYPKCSYPCPDLPDCRDAEPAQRTWVELTDEEIDQGLLRTPYAMKTAEAWREGVRWAYHQLKEKNK